MQTQSPHLIAALASGLALAAPTIAQGWIDRNPTTSPAARLTYGVMAYDLARGRTVLFGGFGGTISLGDTWEWDGNNWQQKFPVNSPSARRYPALAFDVGRSRVVLFGGMDATGILNDTWEWDGTNWTQAMPANSPAPRWIHTMAYDVARNRVVLFAGRGGAADTWEWDGTNWVQQFPATVPLNRDSHVMAYDWNRFVVVMYGGDIGARTYVDETWEWNGIDWVLRSPASSPGPRRAMAMDYNRSRGTMMMLQGEDTSFANLSDTWEWNGTNWSLLHAVSGPPARRYHGMVWDQVRARMVMFGGNSISNTHLSDTWEWAADAATTRSYGIGCGQTPLTLDASARPVLGTTFQLDTGNVPSGTTAVGVLLSVTQHDPGINLSPIGLTGCSMYTGSEFTVALPASGSKSSLPITVPNNPSLAGQHVFSQSLTVTPGANPAGVLTSNGLDLGVNRQ